VVGTNNTTDFYRATGTGDRLTSTAAPLHRGRSRQVWRVETRDDHGRLVAAGQVAIQNLRA
jgi:acyl-coenzyme A thioesterase PaaI-like protein